MNNAKSDQLKASELQKRREVASRTGIEAGFKTVSLLYNQASRTVLIAAERSSPAVFEQRVFIRGEDEIEYQQISPSSTIHLCDIVANPSTPTAYCRALELIQSHQQNEIAFDWLSVVSIDLVRRTTSNVFTKLDMVLPKPHLSGCVYALHGLSHDGGTIYCTCGLQQVGGTRIEYWLCKLKISTKELEPITLMEGIWF